MESQLGLMKGETDRVDVLDGWIETKKKNNLLNNQSRQSTNHTSIMKKYCDDDQYSFTIIILSTVTQHSCLI